MRKILLLLIPAFLLCACEKHHEKKEEPATESETTILMYMPWSKSGDNDNIQSYFLKNISGMKTAIEYNRGLGNKRFLVLIASDQSHASLIDVKYTNGSCVNDTLKKYTNLSGANYSSVGGLSAFFNDVKSAAPARSYALIVGSHACGWIPAGRYLAAKRGAMLAKGTKLQNDTEDLPLVETRWFGNPSLETYQTNTSTLTAAIRNSFGHTDYILFDDCYMSNIEVAYDFKEITDYLIASTSEIMLAGMPYATIGSALMNKDYSQVVEGFYNFYKDYRNDRGELRNYGTIGVTKMSEVDHITSIMKQINSQFSFEGHLDDLQRLDGYDYTIFFDMGDYVKALCQDEALYQSFESALNNLVPYKKCTEEFFSQPTILERYVIPINTFSGITISDPSVNSGISSAKSQTAWWEATH